MRHLDLHVDVLKVVQAEKTTALQFNVQGELYAWDIPKMDVRTGDSILFNFPYAVSDYKNAIGCYTYDTATIKRGEKVIFTISGEKAKDLERRLEAEFMTTTEKK